MATSTPLRLAFFALVAIVATWPLLSTAGALNEFRDAHVLAHYESVARASVLGFGEAPLWDPYYCGGMYLLGTPQGRFAAPSFLFTLLFGESRGEAITAFAMLIVALEGTFRYARTRGASRVGATLSAPVFGLSGVFVIAPQLGWTNFFGFALVPWIALGFRRALRRDTRGAVLASACIAWCAGFGGTYAVPMVAVWCALETLEAVIIAVRARAWRTILDITIMGGLVASLGAGLAAARLWPVAETLGDAPRVVGGTPGSSYLDMGRMLFGTIHGDSDSGRFFIGVLAVPAILFAFRRVRSVVLAAYGAIWTWLAAGYGVVPSLFAATRGLPVYGTLRYPERYLILLALVVSVLGALGVTVTAALARSAKRRRWAWRAVHAAAITTLALDGVLLVLQHHASAAVRDLSPQPITLDRPFHQARGNRWDLAYYAPMQRGSLSCWDAYPVPESPLLEGDLVQEERLQDPNAGQATERSWSPNRIVLDVDIRKPTRLFVNQNWHRGWRTDVGEIRSERGLLVVDLPVGSRTVTLRFSPRSATGGLVVSLATLVATLLVLRRRTLSTIALCAVALTPPAALAMAFALIKEPAPPPKELLAPTGEPIVVDTLRQGVARLDTHFEGGITLAAASVDHQSAHAGETVVLELDWVREANVDPGLGVFVHFEPSTGDGFNGDHVELSQTLLVEAAPPNKLLRDLLPITFPTDAGQKQWKIFVGLWRIQRGGARVHVTDPGHSSVDDDRIAIATIDVR